MKSPLDYYIELTENVLADVYSDGNYPDRERLRDLKYVTLRSRAEGHSFLTKSLPTLGKAIDRGLETQRFVAPLGFKTLRNSQIPAFMQAIFKRVFSLDGSLLDHPDPYAVQELRQVMFLFYKLELPYSDRQVDKVLSNFVAVEKELSSSIIYTDTKLIRSAKRLIHSVLKGFDPSDIIPRHGPGAVATGEKGTEKWFFRRSYPLLHQFYPWDEYFSPRSELWVRQSPSLETPSQQCAKVVLVPKDSRGPRLISEEPLEIQFIQQGLMRKLVPWIENHPLTRGQVNFTDQTTNQRLALESSVTKAFATLDLKEASDRIRMDLVEDLFPLEFVTFIKACRSSHTQLPSGELVELFKFAPMGSALCFPVMALTLWALSYAYLQETCGSGICSIAVYGDDLIVPTGSADGLIRMLERFSLRVNKDKSYFQGSFRESCGVDAYCGVNVTPYRLRKPWTARSTDTSFIHNAVALSNSLFNRGFWRSAAFIRDSIQDLCGIIPYGSLESGYVSVGVQTSEEAEKFNLLRLPKARKRWNAKYQRWEFRVLCSVSTGVEHPDFQGWERLHHSLLEHGNSGIWRFVRRNGCIKVHPGPQKGSAGTLFSVVVNSPLTQIKWRWRPAS